MRQHNSEIVKGLQNLLADTYILYIKTQNFHWNVTGPHFGALHQLFDDQYQELAAANDLIAERIRALGGYAIGSCNDFTNQSKIIEAHENNFGYQAAEMIKALADDHRSIAEECQAFLEKLTEFGDKETEHLVADRVLAHDKAAWMLKSHLD